MFHPEAKWIQLNKHKKHPLKEVYKNSKFECKCCKSKSKGMRFRCDECDFDIHTTCGTCPTSLVSFKHPQHILQLMEKPQLPYHKCHLCQKLVKGMVYRCKVCNFFMHPICGDLPEILSNHAMHPPHSLKLQLMETSKCDVCDKACNQWRYFCGICDVHIHVGCLNGKKSKDDDDGDEFGDVLGDIISGFAEGISG
ncbi:Diacylglycerol kinase theta [Bienertia sinuspersici]